MQGQHWPWMQPREGILAVTDAIQSYDLNTLAPVAAVPVLRASVNPTRADDDSLGQQRAGFAELPERFQRRPGILLIDGAFVKP